MTENNEGASKVLEIIQDARIAMVTHVDGEGRLVAKPMATQETEFDGTLRFIARRSSAQIQGLLQRPAVNVAYSGSGAWVSLAGTARIVEDVAKLQELWSTFTSSWLEGGPEDPDNVLIEIDADTAEYWGGPGGSKVTQIAQLISAKLGGDKRPAGRNEVVDL